MLHYYLNVLCGNKINYKAEQNSMKACKKNEAELMKLTLVQVSFTKFICNRLIFFKKKIICVLNKVQV